MTVTGRQRTGQNPVPGQAAPGNSRDTNTTSRPHRADADDHQATAPGVRPTASHSQSSAVPWQAGTRQGTAQQQTATSARVWRQRRGSSWLLAGVLAAASSAVTVLFLMTLTNAIARHHWAVAVDSSRDAVPALVGWAGLAIALFAAGPGAECGETALVADSEDVAARAAEVASHEDRVRQAAERVDLLTARLAALTAGLGTAGPGTSQQQSRQVAETAARLEQARQWRASAEDALARRRVELASATTAQQPHGPRSAHLRKADSHVELVSL